MAAISFAGARRYRIPDSIRSMDNQPGADGATRKRGDRGGIKENGRGALRRDKSATRATDRPFFHGQRILTDLAI